MNKRQQGFTLIEIAIVLVIIGLLLGGVLKGQELITSARVRNLISLQDGIKAAYFGFLDRYRALPGDYGQATTNISGVSTSSSCGVATSIGNGNGDGQILVGGTPASAAESTLVWEHLSKSGFINGSYTCATTQGATTTPTNPYGQYLDLSYTAGYQVASGTASTRHVLRTGGNISSDMLAEIDRKVDDGNPGQGSYRGQVGGNVDSTSTNCFTTSAWVTATPGTNCGGVTLY